MYITIDEDDRRPIYQQVVDEVKALIARGELREGSTLPPVRQVAADLGVNLNTIAFAYRELQKEGFVRVKHGSGAVVISRTSRETVEEQVNSRLRTVLTQLLLAGFVQAEILTLVTKELRQLVSERRQK